MFPTSWVLPPKLPSRRPVSTDTFARAALGTGEARQLALTLSLCILSRPSRAVSSRQIHRGPITLLARVSRSKTGRNEKCATRGRVWTVIFFLHLGMDRIRHLDIHDTSMQVFVAALALSLPLFHLSQTPLPYCYETTRFHDPHAHVIVRP